MTPRILIIAGSDSGGGAGIQADIKTVTMLGGHAMTAITAITAQNTLGVQGVLPVPTAMVLQQIDSCLSDIGADAVKIGMIGSAETAHAVADVLEGLTIPIVFDPVMVATSGSVLADDATIAAFERLMRIARLVTPNLPELAALSSVRPELVEGSAFASEEKSSASTSSARTEVEYLAAALAKRIGTPVLAKGGHGEGYVIKDQLFDGDAGVRWWESDRIETRSTHGTGCTLASAIACGLARGLSIIEAVAEAQIFVRMALLEAPKLGSGHGPMGHQRVRLDIPRGLSPNQITVPLCDYEASAAFYRLLGLRQIVASEPRYARFESEGGVTLSIEAADEMPDGPVLFFESADLQTDVARLRAAGMSITEPKAESWGWTEARCTDPAGNAICLYQAGEQRRFPPWRLP